MCIDGYCDGAKTSLTTTETTQSTDASTTAETSSEETSTTTTTMNSNTTSNEVCMADGEIATRTTFEIANVLFLLDKSGSMYSQSWDHDMNGITPDVRRWQSLRELLAEIIAFNDVDTAMNLGALLFPSLAAPNNSCILENIPEVAIAPMNGANILASIPADNDMLLGSAPTRAALELAYTQLRMIASNLDVDQRSKGIVVVLTDSGPLCGDGNLGPDTETPPIIADALLDQIVTFVVGIDVTNIEYRQQLNAMAMAGGHPQMGENQFYEYSQKEQFITDLHAMKSGYSCIVDLVDPPPQLSQVEVSVLDIKYGEVSSCENGVGFELHSNPPQIILCGAACDNFKPTGTLTVRYFCEDSL